MPASRRRLPLEVAAILAVAVSVVICLVNTLSSQAQTPAETPRPAFEVATVKLNTTGEMNAALLRQPGGRFVATNIPLKGLIGYAYRVRPDQISGGPSWINSDRWNVEAKAPEGSVPTPTGPVDMNAPDVYAFMLQSLLEDRFQLKIHRETKDFPAYNLVVASGGAKLILSEDQTPLSYLGAKLPPPPKPGDPMPRGFMTGGPSGISATAVPISNFITFLSQTLQRTVIDKTELNGLYDIHLEWTPEMGQGGPSGPGTPPPPDPSGPSLFTAIQEQLGLKLEATKAPTQIIIIDSAQKPSEN